MAEGVLGGLRPVPVVTGEASSERRNATYAVLPGLASANAKLVYLYLDVVIEARADEVRGALGIPLISLYPVLECLIERGLVVRRGETYALAGA